MRFPTDLDGSIIGKSHEGECRCGCRAVAGVAGRIIEVSYRDDIVIAEHFIPIVPSGTKTRRQLMVYTCAGEPWTGK
jgi:hypothetical protein